MKFRGLCSWLHALPPHCSPACQARRPRNSKAVASRSGAWCRSPARAPSGARAPSPRWRSRSRKSTPRAASAALPIELICYDTQTLEAEALKPISRLVDRDKVLAVIGPCFSGRVRDHRAAARHTVQDGDQFLLLGQARPLRDEQMGVPQHAHQRQAAQARRRGLARRIQDQEGRHHL